MSSILSRWARHWNFLGNVRKGLLKHLLNLVSKKHDWSSKRCPPEVGFFRRWMDWKKEIGSAHRSKAYRRYFRLRPPSTVCRGGAKIRAISRNKRQLQ